MTANEMLESILTTVEMAEYWYTLAHEVDDLISYAWELRSWELLFEAAEKGEI